MSFNLFLVDAFSFCMLVAELIIGNVSIYCSISERRWNLQQLF